MGTYVEVNLEQFDELLKADKGWKKEISGKEFVYDYEMTRFPNIIIKVLTSIKTDTTAARKKGQDAIRVFVIRKVKKGFRVSHVPSQREPGPEGAVFFVFNPHPQRNPRRKRSRSYAYIVSVWQSRAVNEPMISQHGSFVAEAGG